MKNLVLFFCKGGQDKWTRLLFSIQNYPTQLSVRKSSLFALTTCSLLDSDVTISVDFSILLVSCLHFCLDKFVLADFSNLGTMWIMCVMDFIMTAS
jgi:hypothetical protein